MSDRVEHGPSGILPIAFAEGGRWWCTCGRMHDGQVADCECGRTAAELLSEMAYNEKVTAWLESKPLTHGLPELGESKASWWQRMCELYENRGA